MSSKRPPEHEVKINDRTTESPCIDYILHTFGNLLKLPNKRRRSFLRFSRAYSPSYTYSNGISSRDRSLYKDKWRRPELILINLYVSLSSQSKICSALLRDDPRTLKRISVWKRNGRRTHRHFQLLINIVLATETHSNRITRNKALGNKAEQPSEHILLAANCNFRLAAVPALDSTVEFPFYLRARRQFPHFPADPLIDKYLNALFRFVLSGPSGESPAVNT